MAELYKNARGSGKDVVWIDGRPYLPNTKLKEDSIVSVVKRVLALLTEQGVSHTPQILESNPTVTQVQGGATNRLYCVNETVLVRIFGAEGMVDRDTETAIYARLSQQGLAPAYWGRLANGRLEQWLPRMRTLTTPELPKYAKPIAESLKCLHASTPLLQVSKETSAELWQQLETWFEQATLHTDTDMQHLVQKVRPELPWLQSLVGKYRCAAGYCHNDLLAANILVRDDDDGAVQLVDFEYGGMNYFAFDIANHWNEYAGT